MHTHPLNLHDYARLEIAKSRNLACQVQVEKKRHEAIKQQLFKKRDFRRLPKKLRQSYDLLVMSIHEEKIDIKTQTAHAYQADENCMQPSTLPE